MPAPTACLHAHRLAWHAERVGRTDAMRVNPTSPGARCESAVAATATAADA